MCKSKATILNAIDQKKKCSGQCAKCTSKLTYNLFKNTRKTGIWLDQREAFMMTISADDSILAKHILSEIEDYHVVGGARAKTAYGSQIAVSERRFLERKKHQADDYFTKIMAAVGDSDLLYIFGPAEAKVGLKNKIETTTTFKPRLLKVATADIMTEKQRIAQVRKYFEWKK
ncbi:MAG: hypothetical protein AB8G22_24970 [Saprospiraceae bacterium]